MQRIDSPDGGIEVVGRVEHDRRIRARIKAARTRFTKIRAPTHVGNLGRGFFVGDMNVAHGEERQQPRLIGCSWVAGGCQEVPALVRAGIPLPPTVAIDIVGGDVRRVNKRRVRRYGDRRDRPLACPQRGSASGNRKQGQN